MTFLTALLFSCSPDLTDEDIRIAVFQDITINLSLPEYSALNSTGFVYIGGNAGVRGIILHKANATSYRAFERNCSFQPNNACATVDVHSSTLFMQDVCCGSQFSWDGLPTGGPAWRPLRQYQTDLNGNILVITDDVVN